MTVILLILVIALCLSIASLIWDARLNSVAVILVTIALIVGQRL